MMAEGLLNEVKDLLDAGYKATLPAMSGLGYRQLLAHLDGQNTLEEAVERIKFETHRFARQQATWFRQDDPVISWFDIQEAGWQDTIIREVGAWLADYSNPEISTTSPSARI
jgi:tRNA dimethylallyltransferase